MKVITNAQGQLETVDSDSTEAEQQAKENIRRLRTSLRSMLDGNTQFHVDPHTQVYVDEKPVLKWIPWNKDNLSNVGNVLIHCRDFDYPVATNAKFAHESYFEWVEFCVAAPGTVHYAAFDRDMFRA